MGTLHLMAPKCHSRLIQYIEGLRKAATETRLDFEARHTVEYDSVLSQLSISDEIISCVWKQGFFKSSNKCKEVLLKFYYRIY